MKVIDINQERAKRGMKNTNVVREVSSVVETDGGLFVFFTDGKCNFMEMNNMDKRANDE